MQSDGEKCSSLCNGTIRWQCPVRLLCNKFREHHFDCFHVREYKKIASSQPAPPPPPLVIFRSNIVTLRSKKLPVVDTKYRGFWEREVGPGNNENKSMGKNLCLMFFVLFCFVLFVCLFVCFFIDVYGLTPKFNKHLEYDPKCKHLLLRTIIYVIDKGKVSIIRF